MPKFKKCRKRKINVLHKNKKNCHLPSVTLFSKLNIKSKHINTVNWIKNYYSTIVIIIIIIIGTSCPELLIVLKILHLYADHDGASGWPSTWDNSTNAQIRAVISSCLYVFFSFLTSISLYFLCSFHTHIGVGLKLYTDFNPG